MATVIEIKKLFEDCEIDYVDEYDIEAIETDKNELSQEIKSNQSMKDFCISMAGRIDIKKLILTCVWKMDRVTISTFPRINNSQTLEEQNRRKRQKIMEYAKRYINRGDNIILYRADIDSTFTKPTICTISSDVLVYGNKSREEKTENAKLAAVKQMLLSSYKDFDFSDLTLIYSKNYSFVDAFMLTMQRKTLMNEFNMSLDEANDYMNNSKRREKNYDLIFGDEIKRTCMQGVQDYHYGILDDKFLLTIAYRKIEAILDSEKERTPEEMQKLVLEAREFLSAIKNLVDERSKVKLFSRDDGNNMGDFTIKATYTAEDVKKDLCKITKDGRYHSDEEITSGQILLSDLGEYYRYLSIQEGIQLSKVNDNNLRFLADKGVISGATLVNVLCSTEVSETNIVYMYLREYLSKDDLSKIILTRNLNEEAILADIKSTKLDGKKIGEARVALQELGNVYDLLSDDEINGAFVLALNNQDEENLLYLENRGSITNDRLYQSYITNPSILGILKERYGAERIAGLTSTEKILNLYRKKYNDKNDEYQEYEKNVQLYQLNGQRSDDDIILGLEDDFSDDTVTQLYKDGVVALSSAVEYGEIGVLNQIARDGVVREDDIPYVLENAQSKIHENIIKQAYEKGLRDEKQIFDMYLQGKIGFESIRLLGDNAQKVEDEITEEGIVILLQDKNEKQFKRYTLAYRELILKKLSEERIAESRQRVIQLLDGTLSKEEVTRLYAENIVGLNEIIKYGGMILLNSMVKDGKLRPSDTKQIFKNNEDGEVWDIREILSKPDMSDIEKIILVYSTYDQVSEKDLRDSLMNYIYTNNGDMHDEGTSNGEKKEIGKERIVTTRKTVTDPFQRWRLFSLLYENYDKRYVDGYLIVYFDNLDRVVIEKMFDKKFGRNYPAYGKRTYAMPLEEYIQIEDEVIQRDRNGNERINISRLRKAAKESDDIYTTTHRGVGSSKADKMDLRKGWGGRFLRILGIRDLKRQYTLKQAKEIEECLRQIEMTREEIER